MKTCSFCDKTEDEVKRLIVHSRGNPVAICDECVKLCVEVLFESIPGHNQQLVGVGIEGKYQKKPKQNSINASEAKIPTS